MVAGDRAVWLPQPGLEPRLRPAEQAKKVCNPKPAAAVYWGVDYKMPETFEALWHAWYARLVRYGAEFAGLGPEDREEVAGDILWKVWDQRDRYRSGWSLATWVYRIARNCLIDRQRQLTRRQRREQPWPGTGANQADGQPVSQVVAGRNTQPAPVPGPDDWPDPRPGTSPEALAVQAEELEGLQAAVAALPALDRELLYLVYGNGCTVAEAAGVCGLPVGTVKSRLSRARDKLRISLAGPDDPAGSLAAKRKEVVP